MNVSRLAPAASLAWQVNLLRTAGAHDAALARP